jgi:hypothetical protein
MKIVISEGCTAFYTLVDGKDVNDMTPEERSTFIDSLLAKLKTGILENAVNIDCVIKCFNYDDCEYDANGCDQCGDTVSRTIYNI